MKKFIKSFLILNILSSSLLGYDLTVKVDNLRSDDGVVQFSLYNKDGSIPDEKFERYIFQKKSNISHNSTVVVFKDLKEGKYAVNILHDENNDGKLKKGFLLPDEGVGFSNFESINIMNKPNFKKASFLLDNDKSINIKVIYF